MPILEYKCKECGAQTEFFKLKSDEEEPTDCKECGAKGSLEKQFPSSSSFELKGRGWFNKGGY